MGNSDNTPNDGKLSLDTSAPLWSAIMREVSKGETIATFKPPKDIQTATVDAFTGLRPGPFTTKTDQGVLRPGHGPEREGDAPRGGLDRRGERPPVAGRLPGPKVTRGFFNLSDVEANFPAWQRANAAWAARAARGSGVRGGPKGTRTAYFYNGAFTPFGRTWGAPFMPSALCPKYTPPVFCDPFATFDPFATRAAVRPAPDPDRTGTPRPFNTPRPTRTPKPH